MPETPLEGALVTTKGTVIVTFSLAGNASTGALTHRCKNVHCGLVWNSKTCTYTTRTSSVERGLDNPPWSDEHVPGVGRRAAIRTAGDALAACGNARVALLCVAPAPLCPQPRLLRSSTTVRGGVQCGRTSITCFPVSQLVLPGSPRPRQTEPRRWRACRVAPRSTPQKVRADFSPSATAHCQRKLHIPNMCLQGISSSPPC